MNNIRAGTGVMYAAGGKTITAGIENGPANSGNGGGGGYSPSSQAYGGYGGSGIVIIRYSV
jgi:hypothetical protein